MDKGKNPDADGKFVNAPIFNFNDDKLKFNTNRVDNANDHYGSASAFLPKSLLIAQEGVRMDRPLVVMSMILTILRSFFRFQGAVFPARDIFCSL